MKGWMGPACNDPCVHGHPENGRCVCDQCYTGSGCQLECSGHGECVSGKCICNNNAGDAYVGKNCELPGCPGRDRNCEGHGFCNIKLQKCECYPGWTGDACDTLDCPGSPPCSGHGDCSNTNPRTCSCHRQWAGEICEVPCVNGTNYGNASGCICSPCFSGVGCNLECSLNGKCVNGKCVCDKDKGFKGDVCVIPSCPGWPLDCTGHGTCNKATLKCLCASGWSGNACDVPDCPGTPDCNGRGACLPPIKKDGFPKCNCSKGWMGVACELPCKHGSPTDDNICKCEPCYNGPACDMLCSNHSSQCVNGVCECGFEGWRGTHCEKKGCPGYKKDCSGHGQCLISTGKCICDSGWSGKFYFQFRNN